MNPNRAYKGFQQWKQDVQQRGRLPAVAVTYAGLGEQPEKSLIEKAVGLPLLATGSERAVFDAGRAVLKIAHGGSESEAANRKEAELWRMSAKYPNLRSVLVPVLSADSSGHWLVMEKVSTVASAGDLPTDLPVHLHDLKPANWGRHDGQLKLLDYSLWSPARTAARVAARYRAKTAILKQKKREETDQVEWALFDSKGKRVLKWFGAKKPSDEAVAKEERRIQYFKHHSAAQRVCARWLQGGLFKAPPAMLAEIFEWVRSVQASYLLAHVEEKLRVYHERAKVDSAIEAVDKALADIPGLLATAERRKRGLKLDFSTDKLWDGTLKLLWLPEREYKGRIVQEAHWDVTLPGSFYYYPSDGPDPTPIIRASLQAHREKLEQAAKEAPTFQSRGRGFRPLPRKTFVELTRVYKMLRPLVKGKPKKRVTDQEAVFNIDLTGWPYVDDPQEATDKLDNEHGWYNITVRLRFKRKRQDWAGLWERGDRRLSVLMPGAGVNVSIGDMQVSRSDPATVAGVNRQMEVLREVLDHELQHFGQDALKLLKGLGEDAGLPAKHLRDPKLDIHGTPVNPEQRRKMRQRDKRVEHALRDVEFYPNLRTMIREFQVVLARFGKPDHDAVAREFVGADRPRLLKGPNKRFELMRDEAPAKWQKAVKEFLKAVEPMIR